MQIDYRPDDDFYDDLYPDAPEPRWTFRRVFYLVVILIMLITFLVYTLAPSFLAMFPPPPPPSDLPRQQV